MMRWKYLLLITIAIIFSYGCAAIKTSDLIPPEKSDRTAVSTVLPTTQQSQKLVPPDKENLLQQLKLSTQQQQQIEEIRRQYQQQIHQRQEDLKLRQQQLLQMMAGTDSAALIRAKNQELVELRQEIGTLRFESMLATRELLTLQQRQKFRELAESQSLN